MQTQVRFNDNGAALRLREMPRKLQLLAREVVNEEGKLALDLARKYSSITDHSLADLRRMGHPYAAKWRKRVKVGPGKRRSLRAVTGAARIPHAAYLIHRQGGRYYRSWRRALSFHTGGNPTATVYNNARSRGGAPYPIYLETGTTRMIPRPLLAKVAAEVRGQHNSIYRKAYYRHFRR